MGHQAEVYDAEMHALSAAMDHVAHYMDLPLGSASHLHFFADNSSSVDSIFLSKPGPSQRFFISFCEHACDFLAADASHEISVSWVPSHIGIVGNERADELAKEAAQMEGPASATYSHLRRRANERVLETWIEDWAESPPRGLYARASHGQPSLRPPPHFCDLPRHLYGLVTQCRLGHAFMGEYYQRHVPTEDVACPCGKHLQTRDHILLDCERYDDHRHHLAALRPDLNGTHALLSTAKGITALAKFIQSSGAFTKSGEPPPQNP